MRVIGVVAIDQDVNISLDIGEHAADDVAFALQRLRPHHGAGRARHRRCTICRVIIVNVNDGVWKGSAEIADDGRDRGFFVKARDQHRDRRGFVDGPIGVSIRQTARQGQFTWRETWRPGGDCFQHK